MSAKLLARVMENKNLDMVVFGATGFTGKYMVKLIAAREDLQNLKWAIAGRNLEKLRSVLEFASSETGKDLSSVNVLCADVSDEASLTSRCKATKLVLNLVGPYMIYGEPVVKACVENGCHHLDLCGDIQWLEMITQKYGKKAEETGSLCIASCGFDSIPADLGVLFTKSQFPGILNRVEGYFCVTNGLKNSTVNFGTLHSMLYAISNRRQFNDIMSKCDYKPLPDCQPKPSFRLPIFFSGENNRWSALTGADEAMVQKTQRFLYKEKDDRPIQYRACFSTRSLGELLSIAGWLVILVAFSLFRCGRNLVTKYPEMFTGGIFSHEGPTPEQMDKTSFSITFFGHGFSSKEKEKRKEEDMKIVTRVSGPEFAYITTNIAMLEAGLTLLQEKDKVPSQGGMYSPGSTFGQSSIVERCGQQGLQFSVVSAARKV